MNIKLSVALSAVMLAAACAAPSPDNASTDTAEASTSKTLEANAESIEAHMRFLSDDALEGREAGTEGYDQAAAYVAAELEALGVSPAGNDGTYFQTVPLRRSYRVPDGL